MKHELKIIQKNFVPMASGLKNFYLKRVDKSYKPGDLLVMREWSDIMCNYSGRTLTYLITYIYEGCGQYGLAPGYCVLGLRRVKNDG